MDLQLENLKKQITTQKQQDIFFIHQLNKALHLQNFKLETLEEMLQESEDAYEKFYDLEEARATGN